MRIKRNKEVFFKKKKYYCFTGDIPFWEFSEELGQIERVLNSSQYINSDSIQFWFPEFKAQCCGENPDYYCLDQFDWNGEYTCADGKKQS